MPAGARLTGVKRSIRPWRRSVEEFVDTVLARSPHDLIPVMVDGRLVGGAGFKEAKQTPREVWRDVRLSQIMTPLGKIPTVKQDDPIESALSALQKAQASRLLVLDKGNLTGILTLKDLADHLRFRAEFPTLRGAASKRNASLGREAAS